jgi:5-methylcytosine-specific restriction endonuclease McrA
MGKEKKKIRDLFRTSVFERDGHKCRVCKSDKQPLDAHHITDRNQLPGGGYVKENGISLCAECHVKAEIYHSTGTALEDFSPNDLYFLINSSYDKAYQASLKLKE